jgi:hypothetical protein
LYAREGEVVAGAEPPLARHGLPFVPTIHCFLRSGEHHVDLTEGNCNGKKGMILDYIEVREVPVGADEDAGRVEFTERLVEDPRFAGAGAGIAAALQECQQLMRAACVVPGN